MPSSWSTGGAPACGTAKLLVCQYHSWAYDTEGRLKNVPDERDFAGLDRDERALVSLRCEEWDGWIFVCADLETAPLREWLGPIPGQLAELGGERLRFIGRQSAEFTCNWKLAVHAFMEIYHVRTVHPDSAALLYDPRRTTSCSYSVFPNVTIVPDPAASPFIVAWPTGVDSCRLELSWFGADWGEGDPPVEHTGRMDLFETIIAQDTANLAPMQASLRSAAAPMCCSAIRNGSSTTSNDMSTWRSATPCRASSGSPGARPPDRRRQRTRHRTRHRHRSDPGTRSLTHADHFLAHHRSQPGLRARPAAGSSSAIRRTSRPTPPRWGLYNVAMAPETLVEVRFDPETGTVKYLGRFREDWAFNLQLSGMDWSLEGQSDPTLHHVSYQGSRPGRIRSPMTCKETSSSPAGRSSPTTCSLKMTDRSPVLCPISPSR